MFQRIFKTFRLGILAGVLIAIGGAANLQLTSMGHPIVGAIFFSFGLMCVCVLGANLFTGKVGYVLENDKSYLLDVLIMSIGNIIGALAVGYLAGVIFKDWHVATETKFVDNGMFFDSFLRAVGAGAFVYLAVECFKKIDHMVGKLAMIMLSIATMVLLGCNHSIANVFYFAYSQITVPNFNWGIAILSVFVAMIGNSMGSILLYLLQKAITIVPKNRV